MLWKTLLQRVDIFLPEAKWVFLKGVGGTFYRLECTGGSELHLSMHASLLMSCGMLGGSGIIKEIVEFSKNLDLLLN